MDASGGLLVGQTSLSTLPGQRGSLRGDPAGVTVTAVALKAYRNQVLLVFLAHARVPGTVTANVAMSLGAHTPPLSPWPASQWSQDHPGDKLHQGNRAGPGGWILHRNTC